MSDENRDDRRDEDHDDDDGRDEGKTHPFGWVSLLVIATLIVVTYFVVNHLIDDTRMQDCIQSGRRNCAPIDDTNVK